MAMTTPLNQTLPEVAQALKLILSATETPDPVQQKWVNGTCSLVLTLQKQDDAFTLSITKKNQKPSQYEEMLCRRAFEIPEQGIVRYEFVRGSYSVIRLMWKETEQMEIAQ